MPIYEYECQECGEVHEIMQKMSDEALTVCPKCSGKLQKLISNCTFHLKGSGWYATDYAKGNTCASATESKDSNTATEKPSTSEKTSAADSTGTSSDA
ncbi:MAG: FmdB family zinc ribbon protein [Desulfosalsimonadaceae bacterium]